MFDRRIVYIRATDQRPLYIQVHGKYHLIETFYCPDPLGERIECSPYYLRVGDMVRVHYINPIDGKASIRPEYLTIEIETKFTDVYGLKSRAKETAYVFA